MLPQRSEQCSFNPGLVPAPLCLSFSLLTCLLIRVWLHSDRDAFAALAQLTVPEKVCWTFAALSISLPSIHTFSTQDTQLSLSIKYTKIVCFRKFVFVFVMGKASLSYPIMVTENILKYPSKAIWSQKQSKTFYVEPLKTIWSKWAISDGVQFL